MRLVLKPIGHIDDRILLFLTIRLKKVFSGISISISEAMPVPSSSYDPRRDQYRSSLILDEVLSYFKPGAGDKILGIADVDAYSGHLNFVFGEAYVNGRAAVIYLMRLKPEFYGMNPDEGLFLERILKEAVHEIGHTLGLGHCENSRCVMHFSNSILDTDYKEHNFCEKCKKLVEMALKRF
ncbi:MAG TPA: archemetzincin [Candidatus Korarchaeota archaeon]|nr:archemetzincin [Candidatus Korarchaeota archaeon]